jgi:hypothetical protein
MINSKGKSLSVVISCNYGFVSNWMAFSAWYSISKNLPDAKVSILCARDTINMQLFDWVNKTDANFFVHANYGKKLNNPKLNKIYATYVALKNGLVETPCLVMDADTVATRELTGATLKGLGGAEYAVSSSDAVWYFENQTHEKFTEVLNNGDPYDLRKTFGEPLIVDDLCREAREQEMGVFVKYGLGCGKFLRENYESVFSYPFSEKGLRNADMTVNERRVFELWAQMNMAFEALSK